MSNAFCFARSVVRSLVVLAAYWLILGGGAAADEVKIDPEAKKVIDAFGKFFGGLKGFHFSDTVALHIERMGQKQSEEFVQKFTAERPNKLSYSLGSQRGGAAVVSDGKELALYIKGYDKYAIEQAPATFVDLLKEKIAFGAIALGNASTVTVALLAEDPGAKLVENVKSVDYGGLVDLDGVKCHLLEASGGDVDWQLWIDAGAQPLVRKFVPNLEKAYEQLAKAKGQQSPFKDTRIANIVTYKDWQVDPKFPADAFVFQPPKDAARVDSFLEIVTDPAAQELPLHPLLGMPAPPIELELLDGGKFDLASYKGKNVVLLDFWATWCNPCLEVMPIIDKVAAKFKDKGVVFYTVNLEDPPEAIRKFLEGAKLKVPVAMDATGAVAAAYRTEAVPQTVVIAKDGTIQVVKLGLTLDLEESLAKDLQAVLAGKKVADATLEAARKKAAGTKTDAKAPAK
jgi:peroxiredoxin